MYHDMGDGNWWWMMWLMMALFWTIVVGGIAAIVAALTRRHESERPEDALRRRLANGEIDIEQYRALSRELDGGHGSPA
jgi:uncharacterized membrane protein